MARVRFSLPAPPDKSQEAPQRESAMRGFFFRFKSMKALCVCNSGQVRSVTLARMLNKRGDEVLTCGVGDHHSTATIKMLCKWAEIIYVAEAKLVSAIPNEHSGKISFKHMVGPDDWKIPHHADLIRIYRQQFGEEWF